MKLASYRLGPLNLLMQVTIIIPLNSSLSYVSVHIYIYTYLN
jgi:hypothetical protein